MGRAKRVTPIKKRVGGKKPVDSHSVGSQCFAHLRGYRPWPAKIIQQEAVNRYSVLFYGTDNYATLKASDIYPMSLETMRRFGQVTRSGRSKLSKTALDFEKAMEAIRNPTIESDVVIPVSTESNDDDIVIVTPNGRINDGVFYENYSNDSNPRLLVNIDLERSFLATFMKEGAHMDDYSRNELERKSDRSEEEEEKLRLARLNLIFQEKFKVLSTEAALREMIRNLKICLSEHSPYLGPANDILHGILETQLTRVTILKDPDLFFVVDKCCRYQGVSGLVREDMKRLHNNLVQEIRVLSEKIIRKILRILQIQIDGDYHQEVHALVKTFQNRTKHLTVGQKLLLTTEQDIRMYSNP